jgi:hypothetical protein
MNNRIFNAETQKRRDMNGTESQCAVLTERRFITDLHESASLPLCLCASAVRFLALASWVLCLFVHAADGGKVLYQNDFSKADVGKLPDDMLLLDGAFAVQEVSGDKLLQLPGAPLAEGSGVLFGPTESANIAASVRIHSTKKGRREPAFALGLNGNAGYKLQVSAAKKLIEIYKGDDVVAKEPFTWESDSWTVLKLQVRKVKDGEFAVEGKVWKQGTPEPEKWMLTYAEKSEPLAGRASIWGNPFAGTPINFDDLTVSAVK